MLHFVDSARSWWAMKAVMNMGLGERYTFGISMLEDGYKKAAFYACKERSDYYSFSPLSLIFSL